MVRWCVTVGHNTMPLEAHSRTRGGLRGRHRSQINQGNDARGRGLEKGRMNSGHALTALFASMAAGRTRHRVTALHGLRGRGHGQAVEPVGSKGDKDSERDCSGKTHCRRG